MSEANPQHVLAIQQILSEFQKEAPAIWAAHEAEVESVVKKMVREGALLLSGLAKVREELVREAALQAVGQSALDRGMTGEELSALMSNVLPNETLAAMELGTPPSREMIDDLRGRVLLITLTEEDFEQDEIQPEDQA